MRRILAVLITIAGFIPCVADAQIRAEVVARGFTQAVALLADPIFDDVFYVVERAGLVKVVRGGQLLSAPFADLRGEISTTGERGLLGMAFSPDVESGRVFFNFSNANGDIVIARMRRDASYFSTDPASRLDLRWPTGQRAITHPLPNHYGGHLAFGPDGYLYVGLGDGGSSYDAENNAQNPWSPLGKMLRLDVAVDDADADGYRVPADNPFVDEDPIAALPEIWAFGLRNPWRYTFDDFGDGATGALFIADVGQDTREEVNYEPAGAGGRNYGWSVREGRIPLPGFAPRQAAYGPLTGPLFDYEHEGRSVTGGYVYRGSALPSAYVGRYFFADFISSRVWSVGLTTTGVNGTAAVRDVLEHTADLSMTSRVTAFGRDRRGELYLVLFGGTIVKLVADNQPTIAALVPRATLSGRTVMIEWAAAPEGVAIDGYQLEAGSASGLANLATLRAGPDAQSLTFHDVPAGTYYVRIRAIVAGELRRSSPELVVVVPR